ncbi:unnamed protein product [Thelazia callipaeda]|uniref:Protein CNPPD1 n=1 Tax=Thelazia callipaeda TaxID=103827 RepID=A0A0N5CJN2_THECL|nr:unnamed protein product [Thelazia callipaeda]
MSPTSLSYKHLQRRLRRTLYCGNERMKSLPLPLSELAADYFNKHCPYDYMNLDYATSLTRGGCVDACTFLVAMVYLDRMRAVGKKFFEATDPNEMYLSALIIANKYLHDYGEKEFIYTNEWAACASTSIKEINKIELQLLNAMQWNANVSHEEFSCVLRDVEVWIARDSFSKRGFCTYNEIAILGSKLNFIVVFVKPFLISLAVFSAIYTVAVGALFVTSQIVILSNMQRGLIKNDRPSSSPTYSFNFGNLTQILPTLHLELMKTAYKYDVANIPLSFWIRYRY